MRKRITLGIPCYQGVPGEVLEDYMRFAYALGRRYGEYDFFLAIKTKSEQFRARNAIVEAAIQVGSDYVLFLDDDHVIEWQGNNDASPAYDFLHRLIAHQKDIVGALYYQRGGDCRPVLMKETPEGAYQWLNDHEVTGGLQPVDVQGGGCMLIDMRVFDKIPSPWFEPELELGTDIQICRKAAEAGFSVWSDTSIELGHVRSERTIVTSRNRHLHFQNTVQQSLVNHQWASHAVYNRYALDAQTYSGKTFEEMQADAEAYSQHMQCFADYKDKRLYYREAGSPQLSRQVVFHAHPAMLEQLNGFLAMVDCDIPARCLDFGCGSAPVGFELALRGHHVSFIDVDGAAAYEFTKWRAARYTQVNCDFELSGEYDYMLFMDAIEHIDSWEATLERVLQHLKPGGFILTNYFLNQDFDNVEHVSMDHDAVRAFLVSRRIYPFTDMVWMHRVAQVAA